MSAITDKITVQWRDATNLVLGVWLIVSPWILGYVAQQAPTVNAVVVGVVITLAAAAAIYAFQTWEEWANVALAAWLVVSPWVLKYDAMQTATWNQVAIGALVGLLALWEANTEHGSGTRATK